MMTAGATGRKYYHGIDAVRFSAALMVVIFHLGRSINSPGSRGYSISDGKLSTSFHDLVGWGSVGVEIFFVISGLVIANSANGSSAFQFLRSRAGRLYPAVWICASISFLIWRLNGKSDLHNDIAIYIHSLTLFPFGAWIDAPYWTLGHEVIFYGCVWLLLLCGQVRHLEKLGMGIVVITAIYWGGRLFAVATGLHVPGLAHMSSGVFRMMFPLYGGYFALGIFIWMYFNARLSIAGRIFAGVAFACCLAPFVLTALKDGLFPVAMIIWLLGLCAILQASRRPGTLEVESRGLRILRHLGLATYPLYLIHFALGGYVMRALVDRGWTADAAFVMVVCFLILIALLIATRIEPIIRKGIGQGFSWLHARPGRTGRLMAAMSIPNAPVPVNAPAG